MEFDPRTLALVLYDSATSLYCYALTQTLWIKDVFILLRIEKDSSAVAVVIGIVNKFLRPVRTRASIKIGSG